MPALLEYDRIRLVVTTAVTHSEGETAAVGRRLGRALRPGDLVLLDGPLGAGKTAFARGLAEGLGCSGEDVSSPTFTLVQVYRGPTPLQHVDLYRLTPVEAEDLGLDELLEQGVVAVEWPDRWRDAPADAIRVTIAPTGTSDRHITIVGAPDGPATRPGSSGLPW